MIAAPEIERRIRDGLPGARLEALVDLAGDGDHWRATVVAPQFEARTAVDRHRLVYACLRDVLGGALHALSLETLTPDEWEARAAAAVPRRN